MRVHMFAQVLPVAVLRCSQCNWPAQFPFRKNQSQTMAQANLCKHTPASQMVIQRVNGVQRVRQLERRTVRAGSLLSRPSLRNLEAQLVYAGVCWFDAPEEIPGLHASLVLHSHCSCTAPLPLHCTSSQCALAQPCSAQPDSTWCRPLHDMLHAPWLH